MTSWWKSSISIYIVFNSNVVVYGAMTLQEYLTFRRQLVQGSSNLSQYECCVWKIQYPLTRGWAKRYGQLNLSITKVQTLFRQQFPQHKVTVYTDGSCCPQQIGGWGVYMKTTTPDPLTQCGGALDTDNHRMELNAVIQALLFYSNTFRPIDLYSDSQYVINGVTQLEHWRRARWKPQNGKPIKNLDLWKILDILISQQPCILWHWIKGHSGNLGNNHADELARAGREHVSPIMIDSNIDSSRE